MKSLTTHLNHSCEVIVHKDTKSRKEGIALSKELLGDGEVLVGHVNCDYTQEEMFEEATRLNTERTCVLLGMGIVERRQADSAHPIQ
jgi:hypothetical protein